MCSAVQLTKAPFFAKLHETAPNCRDSGITWHQSSQRNLIHKCPMNAFLNRRDGSLEPAAIGGIIYLHQARLHSNLGHPITDTVERRPEGLLFIQSNDQTAFTRTLAKSSCLGILGDHFGDLLRDALD